MASLLQLVQGLSKPKLVSGAEISGPELASLIERMVAALNSRDIPTAGSILEHFNKDLIQKVASSCYAMLRCPTLYQALPRHSAVLRHALILLIES